MIHFKEKKKDFLETHQYLMQIQTDGNYFFSVLSCVSVRIKLFFTYIFSCFWAEWEAH